MSNWKRVLVFGSLGAGAVLFATGRRPAAIALATVGLAVLASEHPEKFEEIWERAPEYVAKGSQIFASLSAMAARLEAQAEQTVRGEWNEAAESYSG